MKNQLSIAAIASLLIAFAGTSCDSVSSKDLAELQGTWSGTLKGQSSPCKVVVAGKNIRFEGPEAGSWHEGTLALEPGSLPQKLRATVKASSLEKAVGKSAGFLYRIEGDSLILAGLAPGQNSYPQGFEDPAARVFILKKQAN